MLHQKLLVGERPYFINMGCLRGFQKHRHMELELNFCLEGSYPIRVGGETVTMTAGDVAVIGSMEPHEFPETNGAENRALTMEMGPVLLGSYFAALERIPFLKLNTAQQPELKALLEEIVALYRSPEAFSDLVIKGDLYKVCACVLRACEAAESDSGALPLRSVANMEKALELIYTQYTGPLQIRTVANLCGYSESNFCKTFKRITGDTFHNVLNRYRIKIACSLLRGTDHTVEQIAFEVGFADSKTFCRVFKEFMGTTAGAYRKQIEKER